MRETKLKLAPIIRGFLLTHKVGVEIDAMQTRRALYEEWGIDIDWHPCASVLDQMHSKQEAICTQAWGYCRYRITGAKQ